MGLAYWKDDRDKIVSAHNRALALARPTTNLEGQEWMIHDRGFQPNVVDILCNGKAIAYDVKRSSAEPLIFTHNASLSARPDTTKKDEKNS